MKSFIPAFLITAALGWCGGPERILNDYKISSESARVTSESGVVQLQVAEKIEGAPSAILHAPGGRWDLDAYQYLEADIRNPNPAKVTVSFFAFVPGGWGGISTFPLHANGREVIEPSALATLRIDLHQRFPDGTQTIDPRNIEHLRFVLAAPQPGTKLEVLRIRAVGAAPSRTQVGPNRLIVPPVSTGKPAPGKRVRMTLPEYPNIPYVLYLPSDWKAGELYPVIVEYAGNIFYWKNTYSTGKAEQGNIGFGMSRGRGAIWLNLPFISADHQSEQVNGWGDPDAAADYAKRAVRTIAERYGGDPGAVILTGFSRGGIACGYLGLRDDSISDVWLAFHSLSGGDGSNWHGADLAGAAGRARRMKGRSSFVTDGKPWQDVLKEAGQPVTFANSGIGAHVDSMMLGNRAPTVQCRDWMTRVLAERPGVHDVSGTVVNASGKPVAGALVESGFTHITRTDRRGRFMIRSLIDGKRSVTVSAPGLAFEPVVVEISGRNLTNVVLKAH